MPTKEPECPKCEHTEFTSKRKSIGGKYFQLVVCKGCNAVLGASLDYSDELEKLKRKINNL